MARKVFVVPHTHWDREWYQPHELFRWRLVQVVDELLEHMEANPDYRCFTLDGQSIAIADYLELRPENEDRLRALIEAGRILIGPWWVQPDEFLPTGESHIRNLQRGIRYAGRMGGAMRVGHCPDQFGHIAQMPQLMDQLGRTSICLWRGVPDAVPGWSFWWEAPNGSRLPALYLRDSYSNGWRLPHDPRRLRAWASKLHRERRPGEPALLMNGTDHSRMEKHVPGVIAQASDEDITFEMASLEDYEAAMLAAGLDPHVERGELRVPHSSHVLVGVASARMNLKQRDFAVQSWLERYAEPLELLAYLHCGYDGLPALRHAWRLALENSAHDCICGCSVDQTHREMLPRYDRAEQLARQVARESMAAVAKQMEVGSPGGIAVFRSVPNAAVVVEATVPAEWEGNAFQLPGGETVPAALGPIEPAETLSELELPPEQLQRLLDFIRDGRYEHLAIEDMHCSLEDGVLQLTVEAGDAINTVDEDAVRDRLQRLVQDERATRGHYIVRRRARRRVQAVLPPRETIGVEMLRPIEAPSPPAVVADASAQCISNEHFEVRLDRGELEIRDRDTGLVLRQPGMLIDEGDRGDEYTADIIPDAHRVRQETSLLDLTHDAISATLRMQTIMELPVSLEENRSQRSEQRCRGVEALTDITLRRGLKRVDFRTEVRNQAQDHRLRAVFPLPFRVDAAITENQFYVARRRLHPPVEIGPHAEEPPTTFPQKSFAAFESGRLGVAVFNRGLPEGDVVELPGGAQGYALTLLRCVGWLSRQDLASRRGHAGPRIQTYDSQMLGAHVFEYAVTTYAGDWRSAALLLMAHAFAHPPLALATNERAGRSTGTAPLASFQSPMLVPSAMHRSDQDGGPVLRCWSAAEAPETFRIDAPAGTGPRRVDLLERETAPLDTPQEPWSLPVRPWEIATIRFEPRSGHEQ